MLTLDCLWALGACNDPDPNFYYSGFEPVLTGRGGIRHTTDAGKKHVTQWAARDSNHILEVKTIFLIHVQCLSLFTCNMILLTKQILYLRNNYITLKIHSLTLSNHNCNSMF